MIESDMVEKCSVEDKRQYKRRSFSKSIDYTVSVLNWKRLTRLSLKADVVDISDGGIGIRTGYPIEPGHVLRFYNGLPHDVGIVRWTIKHDVNSYRAGIMFV